MKYRLDVLMYEKGLVKTRSEASALIIEEKVFVNGKLAEKAGMQISGDENIEIKNEVSFVSRGGHKLLKAINEFNLDLQNKICLDIGASTGGFTDCMLKHFAAKVYAIDVGYGQLDWGLRNNPRVVNIEKTNFRYFESGNINEPIDFVSIDVSFISLKKILPNLYNLIKDSQIKTDIIALIKPQFEVGKDKVGKNGIIRSQEDRQFVIDDIKNFSINLGFTFQGLCESPIKGTKGNIEYLLYIKKDALEA